MDVVQDRLECGKVRVDVVQCGDPHRRKDRKGRKDVLEKASRSSRPWPVRAAFASRVYRSRALIVPRRPVESLKYVSQPVRMRSSLARSSLVSGASFTMYMNAWRKLFC